MPFIGISPLFRYSCPGPWSSFQVFNSLEYDKANWNPEYKENYNLKPRTLLALCSIKSRTILLAREYLNMALAPAQTIMDNMINLELCSGFKKWGDNP